MMGVAGILGGALLSAIHGATVVNTIYQDGGAYTTFRAFSPTQPEEPNHHIYFISICMDTISLSLYIYGYYYIYQLNLKNPTTNTPAASRIS